MFFEKTTAKRAARGHREDFPGSLHSAVILPQSRWPVQLPQETLRGVMDLPVPAKPVDRSAPPRWSILVAACNQEAFTRLCLSSVLHWSGSRYELIVVDNASRDGTGEYLRRLASLNPQARIIANRRNLGFAAANNQAMEAAEGEILVLLNNDTIVSPGWLRRLSRPLQDCRIGMSAPLTNRSGGENEISVPYQTLGQFLAFARSLQESPRRDLRCQMLPMCCVALRRSVARQTGPLDEGFQMGLFEDDDYCLRLFRQGYALAAAGDCCVHHFGQASMGSSDSYARLFQENRERFERKWGRVWRRAERPPSPAYQEMTERIRQTCRAWLPAGARLLVLSRGDEELLRLGEFQAEHFMQQADGGYAGHHPADGADAVSRLQGLAQRGAEFVLIPETSSWWLDFYWEFAQFLTEKCELSVHQPAVCRIFRIKAAENRPEAGQERPRP